MKHWLPRGFGVPLEIFNNCLDMGLLWVALLGQELGQMDQEGSDKLSHAVSL